MRIGFFGGSFDPVHNGHISMIKGALESGAVDKVVVIPTARNSFKRGLALSAAPYRYYMVKETLEDIFGDDGRVEVSDVEFFIEGISYTALTLDKLCTGDDEYFWICGSDILPSFDKWRDPEKILSHAALLVAKRPGDPTDIDTEKERLQGIFGELCRIRTFKIKGYEEASSIIRKTGDYEGVPEAAVRFINEHDLYNAGKILHDCSSKAAEDYLEYAIVLYPLLKRKRLLHTLNVGLLSAYYAKCHGADIDKALIAGTLHDCAKELSDEQQRELARKRCGDLFEHIKLLHSPAGATMAREQFGIDDEEILDAITYHTTGRGGMTMIDKVVYLADKLEPARTYADLTEMRRLAPTDLDGALRLCLTSVLDKFRRRGVPPHPLSLQFADELFGKGG